MSDFETQGPLSDARRAQTMHAKLMRDRISSRVKLETKRLEKQIRDIVRSQILNVINGKAEAISPASIIGHLGLTDRQAATVERARVRLLAEGKLKGNALAKDLDKLRVKLLRERAELIAEHETRLAHSLGQRLAWEELFSKGKLKGGKRHWHKLWVASADERTCGVCMEIDGTEATLDGLFADEFYMPPDPHPRCRCSVVLVETKPGWSSPKEGDAGEGPEEEFAGTNIAGGHWVTIKGRPVFIGGDGGGGGGGGAAGGGGTAARFAGGGPTAEEILAPGQPTLIDPEANGWEKLSDKSLGGHSQATIWRDKNGDLWYVKKSDDAKQQSNEVIAGKLYGLAGIAHTETHAAVINGEPWLASRMISHAGAPPASQLGLKEGFSTDAWLGNWDVAGLHGDNTVVGPKGIATRIESGGALLYHGAAGPKSPTQFTSKVGEVEVFKGAPAAGSGKMNEQAAYLFRDVKSADIAKGIRDHVAMVSDAEITAVVSKYGTGMDAVTRKGLTDTLIARREYMKGLLPGLDASAKQEAADAKAAAGGTQQPQGGKLFNLTHQVVKGSGKIAEAAKPATPTVEQLKTLTIANKKPGSNWTADNWDHPDHPRPDEFGAPTNKASALYDEAMKHAKSQISSWKGSAQSPGAQQLRRSAQDELGAMGLIHAPTDAYGSPIGNSSHVPTAMDRIAVRVLYSRTQADFASAGYTDSDRVLLFRGLKFVDKSGKTIKGEEGMKAAGIYTTPMVLEGFSTNKGTAETFNTTTVIPKAVPASNILFSWDTSVGGTGGYAGEKEYFVLHGPKFEALGKTYSGPTTGPATGATAKAPPSKPAGWGGTGPQDLAELAKKLGTTYTGPMTMPKVDLPASLSSAKVVVPKGPLQPSGSGGADAFLAQYSGAKYTKGQLKTVFDAINDGKTIQQAADAGGVNKNYVHGLMNTLKTKYGGVKIGGATVVSSSAVTAAMSQPYTPSVSVPDALYGGLKQVPVAKPTKGTSGRPSSASDLDKGGHFHSPNATITGAVFNEDVYVYNTGPLSHPMATGYTLVPKGSPVPAGHVASTVSQAGIKAYLAKQASPQAPKPPLGTSERPLTPGHIEAWQQGGAGMNHPVKSGSVFDEDVYLWTAHGGHGLQTFKGTLTGKPPSLGAVGGDGYFKLPAGTPSPSGAITAATKSQATLKAIHEAAMATKAQPTATVSHPVPTPEPGKPGIAAFAAKYGGGKYTSSQISQVLSLVKSGKTRAEAAAIVGIPLNTVHGLIFKAKGWM